MFGVPETARDLLLRIQSSLATLHGCRCDRHYFHRHVPNNHYPVTSSKNAQPGALLLATTLSALTALTSISAHAADSKNTAQELRVGFVPGPYADEFKAGVEPQLRKKGYAIKYVEFSTGLEANQAVYRGEIVADVMQHEVYLKSCNERNGTDLVGVVQVPTPPMGLYSKKHRTLAEVKPGARVAVPE